MMARWQQALITTVIGLLYWMAYSTIVATEEPWDGLHYWSVAYPGSMVIAAVIGLVFRRRAWITGLSLTFAQLPIILIHSSIGPFALVAVAFLTVLAIPMIFAASLPSIWARGDRKSDL